MLDIDMRFKQGILFIRLNGILNGDTCMKLEESISTLIEDNGIKYVLFNLNNLDYIDKYGINLILKNYINITNNNGNLIICGIEKLFTYTNSITNNLYQVHDEDKVFELINIWKEILYNKKRNIGF